MKKSPLPSTISLKHYGDYQNMSPSSATRTRNAANNNINNNINNNQYFDNQNVSLFGDPVQYPPQEEFLENLDRNLYRGFRSNSNAASLLEDFPKSNIYGEMKHDEETGIRAISGNIRGKTFDPGVIHQTNPGSLFRNTGPDIQILPESDSSSDNRTSPRYTNLENYEQRLSSNPSDIVDFVDSSYLDVNRNTDDKARRLSEFSEDFHDSFENFKDTREMIVEPPRIFSADQISVNKNLRQYSNESLSSNDWFKPDYQEFTKIPKLRPSSKNVISINRQQIRHESPVATLFNDSGGSCSDGEKPVDVRSSYIEPLPNIRIQPEYTPTQIPVPTPTPNKITTDVPLESSKYDISKPALPDSLHKPLNITEPIPKGLPPTGITSLGKREISPVIMTNAICTGADFRINAPRSHKKPSFTIIKDKPEPASKIPSPKRHTSQKITTKDDRAALSALGQNLSQRSMSSHQLRLPQITGVYNQQQVVESPRPSVQFNMSSGINFSKSFHPFNGAPKGILQQKQPGMPFSGMPSTATQNNRVRSFEALPTKLPPLPNFIPRTPSKRFNKTEDNFYENRSISAAGYNRPFYAIQNPTSRERGLLRIINSAGNSPSRIPKVNSNWVPRSMINLSERRGKSISPQRRASISPPNKKTKRRGRSVSPTFFDRRSSSQTEPRSSISSDRRSSNLTSVTTSDFSYRRNPTSPMRNFTAKRTSSYGTINNKMGRRKSIFQSQPNLLRPRSDSIVNRTNRMSKSQRKVAKPTSLSPIIGTPNKDDPLSPEEIESSERFIASGLNFRDTKMDPLTRIPIRNGSDVITRSESRIHMRAQSQPGSRSNSRGPSLSNSRSGSPMKEFAPTSRPNSRAASLSPSKHTSKSNSRGGSQPSSKPQSRSNSRPTSRQPSRATSRTGSRASSTHKETSIPSNRSRSNSRISLSPPKNRKSSPPKQNSSKKNANSKTKSRSPSPQKTRRKSISPPKPTTRSRSRGRTKSPDKRSQSTKSKTTTSTSRSRSPKKSVRRESPKRSSIRKNDNKSAKNSVNSKNSDISSKRGSSIKRKEGEPTLKREASSLKRGTSNLKRETSNIKKETTTSIKRETSNLKRETSNLKREPSRMSLKKGPPSNTQKDLMKKNPPSNIKKEPSNPKIEATSGKMKREPSNLLKKRTDSNLSSKLEKNTSSKNEKTEITKVDTVNSSDSTKSNDGTTMDTDGKLIPLTKANVVSMTTAAIAAQPVQITTAVTNHALLNKINSSGQLVSSETKIDDVPLAILEKSTKTLENIQKTVAEATDEIQKTIHENLTDLKSLENDMSKVGVTDAKFATSSGTEAPFDKSDSLKTVIENPTLSKNGNATNSHSNVSPAPPTQPIEPNVSVIVKGKSAENTLHPSKAGDVNGGSNGHQSGSGKHKDDERVSVRAISVLPDVECESANLQNSSDIQQVLDESGTIQTLEEGSQGLTNKGKKGAKSSDMSAIHTERSGGGGNGESDKNEKDNNNKGPQGSQELLTGSDEETTGCCGKSKCCRCCTRLCMPCRRCRCNTSKCCKKKHDTTSEKAAVIVKEVNEKTQKQSCWKRMKCCNRKKSQPPIKAGRMETIAEESEVQSKHIRRDMTEPKNGKCTMCLRKMFCCRPANKIETTTDGTEMETVKCCCCIPCKKKVKKPGVPAWQAPPRASQRRESILSEPHGPPQTRCQRIMNKLKFWKKKEPVRKASITSRKQSLVPTNPPEDTRPKLHNDLVEYSSKMKGAIPVLPIYLAYFCTGCNIIIPGLGTILSGFFCLCFGIPRFSQYDSAKARIGSFVINCFVGVAQFFCVLFCFVGWGWSIWWGTIMMKTAKKLQKIRKVEKLELEEEQRQAAAAAAAAAEAVQTANTTKVGATTAPGNTDKDVEAGKS
ncbi:protein stum [Condylostylus longicornis]|uniref:protein stum n=1 Tax=Condylostylus longicornis TaxID=2530218 RepID=UPI00244E390D|nr:protein stum [Condylostylus longicornis]